MHSLIEVRITVAPHERTPPLFMGQGLWLAQEGHSALPQSPYHSFQFSVTAVCGSRMRDENTRMNTLAQAIREA